MCARRSQLATSTRATPASAFASSRSTASSINICSASSGSKSAGGAYADLRVGVLFAAAGDLRRPQLQQRARDGVQQLHRRRAVAGDQPGFDRRAQPRAQQRAGAGADAQRHDRRHPGAAQPTPRSASPMRSPPPTTRCSRSPSSTSSSPARTSPTPRMRRSPTSATTTSISLSQLMDIRVVTERPQPGQRLHQFRHPAGRRRRRATGLRRPGHGVGGDAVGRRSDQAQPRHAHAGVAERRRRST